MKLRKMLLATALVVLLVVVAGITLTVGWRPFIGPKARPLKQGAFERTPQRLVRGRYLANSLTGCVDCHSPGDWRVHGGPVIPGKEGIGAPFPLPGFPGSLVAPNLTPDPETGSGKWTDDQIARAIREGIKHDGTAIFPLMPYSEFKNMSDEDVASIVVYIRSLPPVRHQLHATKINFPLNRLIQNVPQPVTEPVPTPSPADRLAWGKYLVTLGACEGCHTPSVHGQAIPGMDFGGGNVFSGPWGEVASSNLSSDPSGIPYYDEGLFIKAMRTGYVNARELKAIMPYEVYGKLTDDDLKAMFAYLRTLKPVKHRVDNREPATYCKLCRQKHGGGDKN